MVLRLYLFFVSSEAAPVGVESTSLTIWRLWHMFAKAGPVLCLKISFTLWKLWIMLFIHSISWTHNRPSWCLKCLWLILTFSKMKAVLLFHSSHVVLERRVSWMPGNVNECQTHPPVLCLRQSTLQTPSTVPPVCGWPWPRSRRGTWEINRAGLLTQQVPRLPSTHPGPICQLASCSTEPWQQGTTSPARLHYACQMGWELDSNSHYGGREWRENEAGREAEEEGRNVCVGGKVMVFVFIYVASYYILM